MRAMVLDAPRTPLRAAELPGPEPGPGEVLLEVHACGVCRTDLHIVDGELTDPKLPLVPGHQIVGRVVASARGERFAPGDRVGVPVARLDRRHLPLLPRGRENLCDARAVHGLRPRRRLRRAGRGRRALLLPAARTGIPDLQAAPLLCAGLIGYRALRLAGDAERLGLYGFGAAAHIVCQVARHQGRRVFAFTRPGDEEGRSASRASSGPSGRADSDGPPPEELDAALIFAPAGELVPAALRATAQGRRRRLRAGST